MRTLDVNGWKWAALAVSLLMWAVAIFLLLELVS